MAFTKPFPRRSEKSAYPMWEDITLTDEQEKQAEEDARKANLEIMSKCIDDARKLFIDKNMRDYQTNVVQVAIALFEKLASHAAFWKENKAREIFLEKKNKK